MSTSKRCERGWVEAAEPTHAPEGRTRRLYVRFGGTRSFASAELPTHKPYVAISKSALYGVFCERQSSEANGSSVYQW
jgi:hypothetical protein